MFELTWQTFLVVCPLVFLAGLVDSIAGGGGLISLPAYLICGVPAHHALATNKLSSCIGTTVSTARYIKKGYANWKLGIPSILLAICGSMIGARLVLMVDERVVQYLLLGCLPVIAFFMLRKKDMEVPEEVRQAMPKKRQMFIVLAASFLIGCYDGFYGPGTGTFLLLVYTQLAKLDVRTSSGNVKLVNLSSNFGSLIVFLSNNECVIPLGLAAGAFCLLGHYIGAGMVIKNGGRVVKPIILVVMVLLFVKVISGLWS
ncbi:MAG: TSUP family transporter [Firmicutes bacterium]|nr:TSUP family transporter [Bacillota bacterium]